MKELIQVPNNINDNNNNLNNCRTGETVLNN